MAVDKTGEARTFMSTLVGRCFPKTLRRLALWTAACFLLSSVGLSHSQGSGSGSGVEPDNVTIVCPVNSSCSELGPPCIVCDFNSSCAYGNETEVLCQPKESVECVVSSNRLCHPLNDPHPPVRTHCARVA